MSSSSDTKLNLILQWNAFNLKRIGLLKPPAISIYVTLLDLANRASFSGGVTSSISVDNERLMRLSGIGSKQTLIEHRNILIRHGFISYSSGGHFVDGKRVSGCYTIIKLY